MKNENVTSEMIDILRESSKYVPKCNDRLSQIFFGGDQLTSERSRNAQLAMQDGGNDEQRLNGLICKAEDWHAKINFLKIIFQILYRESSEREPGTLSRLQKLINRRYVSKKATKHVAATEEFLSLVTDAYVTQVAMTYLNMNSVADKPELLQKQIRDKGIEVLHSVAKEIVNDFVLTHDAPVVTEYEKLKKTKGIRGDKYCCRHHHCERDFVFEKARIYHEVKLHGCTFDRSDNEASNVTVIMLDRIHAYGAALLKLGLLYRSFEDAIREGDGERVCALWKFLLLHFYTYCHTKYALEALILIVRLNFTL